MYGAELAEVAVVDLHVVVHRVDVDLEADIVAVVVKKCSRYIKKKKSRKTGLF